MQVERRIAKEYHTPGLTDHPAISLPRSSFPFVCIYASEIRRGASLRLYHTYSSPPYFQCPAPLPLFHRSLPVVVLVSLLLPPRFRSFSPTTLSLFSVFVSFDFAVTPFQRFFFAHVFSLSFSKLCHRRRNIEINAPMQTQPRPGCM